MLMFDHMGRNPILKSQQGRKVCKNDIREQKMQFATNFQCIIYRTGNN